MTVAVITGAASGIGAGLAREAARRGMKLVLADRDAARLDEVAASIGDAALAVPTDVTDPAALQALADAAYATHGQVDLLFNNAGVLSTGLSWEIPADRWQMSLDVNVRGIVNALRAFVPRLIAADRPARIINTASVGGFLPAPLMAPYSATKFAVVALTESLAGELSMLGSKVQVSLLAPGPVKSISPMCETSKMPTASRTALCSARMPSYWSGMCQPPKSTILAPRATCRSWSGVRFNGR